MNCRRNVSQVVMCLDTPMSLICASMKAAAGTNGMSLWKASGLLVFMISIHCRLMVICPK